MTRTGTASRHTGRGNDCRVTEIVGSQSIYCFSIRTNNDWLYVPESSLDLNSHDFLDGTSVADVTKSTAHDAIFRANFTNVG